MMATVLPMPGAMTPVARILSNFDRDQIASFIEVAIGLLDVADLPDDPDEPDFAPRSDRLPGDPADTEPDDDAKGDQAWTEWHTRGRHKLARGSYETGNTQAASHLEDTEEDNPREANGVELDGSAAEDEELPGIARYYADKGPGCPISDTGIGDMDGQHTA